MWRNLGRVAAYEMYLGSRRNIDAAAQCAAKFAWPAFPLFCKLLAKKIAAALSEVQPVVLGLDKQTVHLSEKLWYCLLLQEMAQLARSLVKGKHWVWLNKIFLNHALGTYPWKFPFRGCPAEFAAALANK